jgi:hypothetical protein
MSYQKHLPTVALLTGLTLATSLTGAHGATVAYWNFDQGTAGTPFATTPVVDLSGNNNTMFGYNAFYGPSYSADTPDGSGLSSRHDANHQDGYTAGGVVNSWSPLTWTIELSLKLDSQGGWNTIIGRDGSSGGPKSDFYIQNNGINDRLRLDFKTLDGSNYVLDSDFVPNVGQWYGFAMVSDGTQVTMYADKQDGNGYQAVGALTMSGANNALANGNNGNWTFGRGWYNGGFVDHIAGNLDNIRFSDTALGVGDLLSVPEPGSATLLLVGGLSVIALRRKSQA